MFDKAVKSHWMSTFSIFLWWKFQPQKNDFPESAVKAGVSYLSISTILSLLEKVASIETHKVVSSDITISALGKRWWGVELVRRVRLEGLRRFFPRQILWLAQECSRHDRWNEVSIRKLFSQLNHWTKVFYLDWIQYFHLTEHNHIEQSWLCLQSWFLTFIPLA